MKEMNNKVQLSVAASRSKSNDKTGPVRLEINHLLGVFGLWWIGIGFSFVVFILELLWFYCSRD